MDRLSCLPFPLDGSEDTAGLGTQQPKATAPMVSQLQKVTWGSVSERWHADEGGELRALAPLHLAWIRPGKDWFRPLLDQKRDCRSPTAVPGGLCLPTIPRVAALSLGTNATKPKCNQSVYGSRRELLNPAWQLINELIRLCGEREGQGYLPSCKLPGCPGPSLDLMPFPRQDADSRDLAGQERPSPNSPDSVI